MRQISRSFVLALVVVCSSSVVAVAADWCFNSANAIIVAQSFTKPGKGSCKPILGHSTLGDPITGVACLSSDGDTLRVAYTVHGGAIIEDGRLTIPYPALTGGSASFLQIAATGTSELTGIASAAVCDPPRQVVP